MTAREALYNIKKIFIDEYNFPFNLTIEYQVLYQALAELEAIKSADGGELLEELDNIYNKPFDIVKLDNAPLSSIPQFANFAKHTYNFVLKSQSQERELEELKKRDTAMKAKIISHLGAGLYSFVCGNCGKYFTLDSTQHNYCIFCGQKLDWGNKDE